LTGPGARGLLGEWARGQADPDTAPDRPRTRPGAIDAKESRPVPQFPGSADSSVIHMLALSEWKPDDLVKALAFFGAALAFIVGLVQYRRAQQWKRAEWVAQEMKGLFGDPLVQAALLMIDWGSRRIPLYPDRKEESERYVPLTNEAVAKALMIHDDRPDGFSDLEANIRAAFDKALDGFERFHAYVDTGLVELSDLRPYLKYWAIQLCRPRTPRPNEHRLARLAAYMDRYGYEGAHDLLKRIAAAERVVVADAVAQPSAAGSAPSGPGQPS
jgi:hypothetical protein